jgi:hypothetical protein
LAVVNFAMAVFTDKWGYAVIAYTPMGLRAQEPRGRPDILSTRTWAEFTHSDSMSLFEVDTWVASGIAAIHEML